MKISALRLHNVRRFAGKGVAIEGIGEGVNVLSAANEFGKSTSFEALHALFFQPHTGASKDVKRLQPYSGGSPLIQADIETANGRFRLTKKFLSGKHASIVDLDNGRLVAQADEAENFIAALMRGGTAEPAGLLWVRQGVTGIEQRDKKEEEGEKRIRESLLTSVQGEVEAITGGRRMAEIIELCNEELTKLVTATMRPKAGRPYALAVEEQKRLTDEELRLRGEVELLRGALDERSNVLKRLSVLENAEDEVARQSAVEKAIAVYEAAKAHREALKAAEAEAALARAQLDNAERVLVEFRANAKRAVELQALLAAIAQERKDVLTRRDAASTAMDKAIATAQTAEAEELEARNLLQRLEAALKVRQAAQELIQLRERLQKAEFLRGNLEALEAELKLLAIAPKLVDQLQALEVELASLRAAKEASLPTLRMAYNAGSSPVVTLNGKALVEGEEQSFGDLAEAQLAGIGTLSLRSNRPAGADAKLLAKENERRKLLETGGIADLAEARQWQAKAQTKASERDQLKLHLEHLAPDGLTRLREEVASRDTLGTAEPDVDGDPETARQKHAEASQKASVANNAIREAQPMRGHADAALMTVETRHATLQAELTHIGTLLGHKGKEALLAATQRELKTQFEAQEGKAAGLRQAAPDLAAAEATLQRTRSAQDGANREKAALREKMAELNAHIRSRSDDAVEEAWRETIETLAAVSERVKRFETEVAVLDRLRMALQESRSQARDLYLQPVINELRPLLNLLFDDVSIVFDEKTLLPQSICRNGQDEDVEQLSGGMREQLSVLTRLAFARMLAGNGRPAPVILDDALVYSDDDRIEKMFDALHRQSRDQQIIVFSCRQRAFSKLGGNTLQMTEWHPE